MLLNNTTCSHECWTDLNNRFSLILFCMSPWKCLKISHVNGNLLEIITDHISSRNCLQKILQMLSNDNSVLYQRTNDNIFVPMSNDNYGTIESFVRQKSIMIKDFSPQSHTRELREHIYMMHCFMLTSARPKRTQLGLSTLSKCQHTIWQWKW